MDRRLFLILLFVFVDVLGFSLVLPLLPYYAATFGAEPVVIGLLLSSNAVAQFIGTPILGHLSDRYGRRPLLILSIAGTVAGFLLLGLANSLWMLFVSRVVDGLLGGNVSLAQAYISDITESRNRAQGLGLVGAAFGFGFIFGPVLGGTLSAGGNYALPALAAAALAALNLVGVLIWLPESLSPEERAAGAQDPGMALSARALWGALRLPCVGPLLVFRFFYGLAFTTFTTTFALFAQRRLSLDVRTTSYVFAYVGLLVVAVQGGGIRLLTRYWSDRQLMFGASILLGLSLFAWALVPTVWVLLAVLVPLALSNGVANVTSNSALTKAARSRDVGGVLGLSGSLGSLDRILSPTIGGFLLGQVGPAAPGILGGLLMAWATYYVWWRVLPVPEESCPPDLDDSSG